MWVVVGETGKECIRAEVWCMRVLHEGRGRVMRKERE